MNTPRHALVILSAAALALLTPGCQTQPVAATAATPDMTFTLNGAPAAVGEVAPADLKDLVLDNGLIKITFGHDTRGEISATSLLKNGQELIHNLNGVQPRDTDAKRSFYHDWSASGGMMHITTVKIIKNTPELAHFALIGNGPPYLEDHYVMLKGESGIHPYVIIKGQFGGEMRTMYRFDMHLLDWTWTNERVAQQKSYAFLQAISTAGNVGDETWRLPDGTIYSKYDYVLYYSESPMWGHFGHGFGAFFMPVSTESYASGPLRQELAVHQDALILNYLGGGHFSGGGPAGGRTGEKIHGPWFLYFNAAPTPEALIADALKTAAAQKQQWPYPWMEEPLYPVKRTTVTGTLKISHDRSAAYATIILGQPGNPARGGGGGGRGARGGAAPAPTAALSPALDPANYAAFGPGGSVFGQEVAPTDAASVGGGRGGRGGGGAPNAGAAADRASVIYTQAGDYIFSVKADANGRFTLPAVRPGTYTLYAWQNQGSITQSFAKDGVEVKGNTLDLGEVSWDPPYHPNLLFQVGQADRMAGEFKFGDQPRTSQWMLQVPANLTFTVGQSKERTDWYYAQKTGTWTVKFNLAKAVTGNGYLTIAIAGGGGSVTAAINGTSVGSLNYSDDASVRRATNRSGRYARNEYTFPASILKAGENTLTLSANGAGLMYDTIVLESD